MRSGGAPSSFVLAVRLLGGRDPERQWRGFLAGPREGGAEYYRAAVVLATVAMVAFFAVSLSAVAVLGSQLPWWAYHLLVAFFVVSLGVVYSLRAAADGAQDGQSVRPRELAVTWALVVTVVVLTYVWVV